MMNQDSMTLEDLLEGLRSWAGVSVDRSDQVPTIRLKNRVIARFPDQDSLEAVLFGTLRDQLHDNADEIPDGVWPTEDYDRLLVDLRAPSGMETAVRALMNCYLAAKSNACGDWWMKPERMKEDPKCEKVARIIQLHRQSRGAEY